jgi:diguanylate cyclase (GGDEF)-like protein
MSTPLQFWVPTEARFQRVARLAARVFGLSGAAILLAGDRERWLRTRHGVHLDSAPRRDPMAERVVALGRAIVVGTGESADRHAPPDAPPFYVGLPLRAPDGRVVGVLSVTDVQPRAVRPADRALLDDLAAIVEDEFRRMQLTTIRRGLIEELSDARRRALLDPLTHLWNRAGLAEHLAREIPRSVSLARPLSLAMADLDRFKAVNDTHGHVVGDLVLEAVAERLRIAARPEDIVARYGGEEFAVLLAGCAEPDALVVAERLRQRIAGEPFRPRTGVALALSISVGVATHRPGEGAEELIARADAALYEAKRAGRDRVTLA